MSGHQCHAEHSPNSFTEEQLQAHRAKLERQHMWRQKVTQRTGQLLAAAQEERRTYQTCERTCDSPEGCSQPIHAKRLCMRNYQRRRRSTHRRLSAQ